MVFAALGADKIITDQDIAEGVVTIEKEMANVKQPTTLAELNALVKPLPGADAIAQGQQNKAEAERKHKLWVDELLESL